MRGELLTQRFAAISCLVIELAGIGRRFGKFATEQRLQNPLAANHRTRAVRRGRGGEHRGHAEQAGTLVIGEFHRLHDLAAHVEAIDFGELGIRESLAAVEQTRETAAAAKEVFKHEHRLQLHRLRQRGGEVAELPRIWHMLGAESGKAEPLA